MYEWTYINYVYSIHTLCIITSKYDLTTYLRKLNLFVKKKLQYDYFSWPFENVSNRVRKNSGIHYNCLANRANSALSINIWILFYISLTVSSRVELKIYNYTTTSDTPNRINPACIRILPIAISPAAKSRAYSYFSSITHCTRAQAQTRSQ